MMEGRGKRRNPRYPEKIAHAPTGIGGSRQACFYRECGAEEKRERGDKGTRKKSLFALCI